MTTVGRESLPGLPGLLQMHMTVVEHDDDAATVEGRMTVQPEHLAPTGYLHAATVVALADTAAGYGCLASLPAGKTGFATIELKTNFMGTARVGELLLVNATAVHRGRTTQVWDAIVCRSNIELRGLSWGYAAW